MRLTHLAAHALPLLLLPAVAAPAAAQVLAGTVRDSASGAVVPGAVVTLLGPDGAALRNVVTDARGAYRIAVAGARAVRVRRIGFRPVALEIASPLPNALDVRLAAVPTLLATVEVLDQPRCPRRGDRARALALWGQARSALLAAVVARDASPAFLRRLVFSRLPGVRRPGLLSQVVAVDSLRGGRPFAAARSAAELVRDGFRVTNGDEYEYFGPDADVLLDEAFAAAYCFGLARPDRDRPTRVGLTFEPAARRDDATDIEGTLWVDTTERVLDELSFQYVGLFTAGRAPGGEVSFHTMPNGVPLVDRWLLRLGDRRGGRPADAFETGGEIATVRWEDGAEWEASLASVRGRLVRDGRPVASAGVRLAGTDYAATTDERGAFEIRRLVPGRYTLALADSALNAAGFELTREQAFVAVRESTHEVEMEAPSEYDLVAAQCPSHRQGGGALAGRVRTPDGRPAFGARFTIWRDAKRVMEEEVGRGVTFRSVYHGAEGDGGAFFVCNLPRSGQYRVAARLGDVSAETTFTFDVADRRIAAVALTLGGSATPSTIPR